MKNIYLWLRDLHLYLGLFMSPFVIVFAVSVFVLTHNWFPPEAGAGQQRTVTGIDIPDGIEKLEGRERVDRLRPVLDRLGVQGEINYVIKRSRDGRLIAPVGMPGRETVVDLNWRDRAATITSRDTGLRDATVYLHKLPGPHNVNLRGNWWVIGLWSWFADGVVYLLLFISATGVYLWAVLRNERRAGLILLGAGILTFFGVVYALC